MTEKEIRELLAALGAAPSLFALDAASVAKIERFRQDPDVGERMEKRLDDLLKEDVCGPANDAADGMRALSARLCARMTDRTDELTRRGLAGGFRFSLTEEEQNDLLQLLSSAHRGLLTAVRAAAGWSGEAASAAENLRRITSELASLAGDARLADAGYLLSLGAAAAAATADRKTAAVRERSARLVTCYEKLTADAIGNAECCERIESALWQTISGLSELLASAGNGGGLPPSAGAETVRVLGKAAAEIGGLADRMKHIQG